MMMDLHPRTVLFLLLLLLIVRCGFSWNIFSSSSNSNHDKSSDEAGGGAVAFSMDDTNSQKGIELVQNARNKLLAGGSNVCWQNAYSSLFSACSEILATDDKRSRLAWHLSNCFQQDSGRPAFPSCDSKSTMTKCLKKLDDYAHKIYLEFYLETNTICHQLQTHAFKHDTERLVNDLKKSAHFAHDKLDDIQEQSELLLSNSNQIHDSLASIDIRTEQVAQASRNAEARISLVLKHSEAVYEQSKEISASQSLLQEGQGKMKEKLEEGMTMLHDSHDKLGQEITHLRNEAAEIEKEISKVGYEISSKMDNLQSKAIDIENMAGASIEKQKRLLDGQSVALESLQYLTTFQSQALEESRGTLQKLAEFGNKKQEELLERQKQLQGVHDHLFENSKAMLAAQQAFESKQTSMFVALDKLFALHNAMLIESRMIKAFFIYSMSIFIIYMFTSTKQTYTVRPWLYIGLCVTFLTEVSILRFARNDIEQQAWIISVLRSLFAVVSLVQLLYAIYTYRDYEVLNHHMLQTLIDKVNGMEKNRMSALEMETERDVSSWSSWIETELPEDVNKLEDPDYLLPEEVGENSITTTTTSPFVKRNYNLRQRCNG